MFIFIVKKALTPSLVNKPKDAFHPSYIHVFDNIYISITQKKMGEEGLAYSII